MTTKILSLAFVVLGAVQFSMAQGYEDRYNGYETSRIGSDLNLARGETETLKLRGWRKVQKLIIQAEGSSSSGTFEVVVNGDVKGTVYVPGKDPSYIVTVESVTNSIQFRHVSGGRIHLRDVKAVMSDCDVVVDRDEGPSSIGLEARNRAAKIAKRAITYVDILEHYTNFKDYGAYLLPIKKAAGNAFAKANARGDMSDKVREALLALQGEIELAKPYIDDTFERDAAFETAVQLLGLKEEINTVLN